ncbi:sterol desaturase family protein [Sulfitobacter sp. S190]|uniref:sterol desaturase family protein n=1 Tax=Sulfitobacter sp. S190 TaxID=2867022 RepID=UPI0021A60680|nr:sterol desaturase family protein [Sulfitobacter sp. S190]UWR22810.1 fatty acid hydroxylase [Sulfitobacter sp. S190]
MTRLKIMFSHAAVVVMALAALAGIVTLALGAPAWVWLAVPLGVAAQMLNEYNLHRHVFHLAPPRRQWAFDLLYQAHYGHHDFPTNTALFFVPVWVAVPMLVVNFALVWAIAALAGVGAAFYVAVAIVPVGGVLTFLCYEWFHMTAHLTVPKTRVERHVTQLHNQHHFRDFAKWFHVSPGGEIIDRAMGTAIDRDTLKSQQRIEFIRTLGMRPDDPRLVAARRRFASRYGLSARDIERAAAA